MATREPTAKSSPRRSVRRQVVRVAFAVALPLAALAAWRALDRRQAELKALEATARENLSVVISDLEAQIENSQAVLVGISRLVDLAGPVARNDAILQDLFQSAPVRFANVWVIDSAGFNVGALRLPPNGRETPFLSRRPAVGQARASGRFTVGTVARSRVLPGAPFVLTLLLPIRGPDGSGPVRGMVGGALEVDSLKAFRVARRLPKGSVITVQDSTGTVIMRSLDAANWIGRDLGNTQGFRDVMQIGEGVDMTRSADGVTRQIAFRVLQRPRWVVYVGIPEAATLAVVQQQFVFDLGLGLLVTLLVLGVAVRQVGRIVEPIEALTRDATAIASGDESRRTTIGTADEIGDLALAINRMADTAADRLHAIERDAVARRAAERALEESREQLRQAQKMEAMGSFAGGIAHDFNNYLSSIVGYAEMALTELEGQPKPQADVRAVLAAAQRASDLTRQILVFSRKSVVEPQVVDVGDVVRGIDRLLAPILGEGVRLQLALAPAPTFVRADRGQLEQVIVNLAANARDAMPKGGTLTISTTPLEIAEADTAHPGVPPGPWVLLAARDTGVGMPPEVRERIFEPFFTTKERGRGTGLGLALVYSMVRQAGGLIRVESAPDEGAAFHLYLRRVASGDVQAVTPAPSTPDLGRGERILVAEDDAAVRAMTLQLLTRAGYTAHGVEDGAAALAVLEQDPQWDLLLTDVVMPGVHGADLLRRVHAVAAQVPVLVMSGYADDDALVRDVRDAAVPFLAKPFTSDQLLERVRHTLARPSMSGFTAAAATRVEAPRPPAG